MVEFFQCEDAVGQRMLTLTLFLMVVLSFDFHIRLETALGIRHTEKQNKTKKNQVSHDPWEVWCRVWWIK